MSRYFDGLYQGAVLGAGGVLYLTSPFARHTINKVSRIAGTTAFRVGRTGVPLVSKAAVKVAKVAIPLVAKAALGVARGASVASGAKIGAVVGGAIGAITGGVPGAVKGVTKGVKIGAKVGGVVGGVKIVPTKAAAAGATRASKLLKVAGKGASLGGKVLGVVGIVVTGADAGHALFVQKDPSLSVAIIAESLTFGLAPTEAGFYNRSFGEGPKAGPAPRIGRLKGRIGIRRDLVES